MKNKITPLSRICGIILGIIMTVVLASVSIHSMLVSTSFYLGQNDKYDLTEEMKLLSVDDYLQIVQNIQDAFSFKEIDVNETITVQGDVENFEDAFIILDSVVLEEESKTVLGSVELSEKFISTVKKLEKTKGGKTDEQLNKALLNNIMGLKITSEAGLTIKDVKFTDASGAELKSTIYSITQYSDGSVKRTETKENFIVLEPKEDAESEVDVFFFGEETGAIDLSKINYSFVVEGDVDAQAKVLFSYKDSLTKEKITRIVGREVPLYTQNEQEVFAQTQSTLKVGIVLNAIIFILGVAIIIAGIKKQGKTVLFGIGFYAALTMVSLAAAINIVAVKGDFSQIISFGFEKSTFMAWIFTEDFVRNFASGFARFYDFMLIIPAGIIYILMRIAMPKKGDPNDDYLYQ